MSEVYITPDQLRELARVIAKAVIRTSLVGRAAFSVAEAAEACGYSTDHLYREIRAMRLIAVRPGDGCEMRVLPDQLALWLRGQRKAEDAVVTGVDPEVAERNARNRRGK